MDLEGKLVLVDGIVSRPELNGTLGLVLSPIDDANGNGGCGRCQVRPIHEECHSGRTLSLRAACLTAWAAQPIVLGGEGRTASGPDEEKKGDDGEDEVDSIQALCDLFDNATSAELLRLMRERRCILSTDRDLTNACVQRFLNLPIKTTGEELMKGGMIEMLVQSLGSHEKDRFGTWCILTALHMTFQGGPLKVDVEGQRHTLLSSMKDRAVQAGLVDRLGRILEEHLTGDVQSAVFSTLEQLVCGGQWPETEARQRACAALLPKIVGSMNLAPHKSANQHFGMQAVAHIVQCRPEYCDAFMEWGGHVTVLEAMRRHGHIVGGEDGICSHRIELAAGMPHATARVPGSILLAGCQLLYCLARSCKGDANQPARIKALDDAGALGAIAAAVRINPKFGGLHEEEEDTVWKQEETHMVDRDLFNAKFVLLLIGSLCSDHPVKDVIPNEEDRLILLGEVARDPANDVTLQMIMDEMTKMEAKDIVGPSVLGVSLMRSMLKEEGLSVRFEPDKPTAGE